MLTPLVEHGSRCVRLRCLQVFTHTEFDARRGLQEAGNEYQTFLISEIWNTYRNHTYRTLYSARSSWQGSIAIQSGTHLGHSEVVAAIDSGEMAAPSVIGGTMSYSRMSIVLRLTFCLLAGVLAASSVATAQSRASQDQQTLWNLERAYWRYAQGNDLAAYLRLWDNNFLGWPVSSATPVRKDRITDWITSQTSKGLVLKSVEFGPASMQVNGNVAVVYYRIKFAWRDKHGKDATYASRITHTWLKTGKDWRIIGGMSMLEPKN